MRVRRWIAGAILLAASGAATPSASAQVYLRGQAEAVVGDVVSVGAEGVSVRGGVGGGMKMVSWDRVREVRGEHGAKAAEYAAMSDQLWRARTRLERGDFAAAEPLFDGLVDRARGMQGGGPTAAVVFEGLLQCRARRGAQIPAVWAWLEWTGTRSGGGEWIGGKVEAARVIDGETGLAPALPPVFMRDAALDASAASEEWARLMAPQSRSVGKGGTELAALYWAAVRFEAGQPLDTIPEPTETPGVRLTAEVVRARIGDEKMRGEARAALRQRLESKEIEPWVECWCRVGLGRSLIRETDAESRREGVVQLLHAPARFVRVSPALAAIALAEAAVVMHELGDELGAVALKAELIDRFPRTPATGWNRLREIRVPGSSAGAVPAKDGDGRESSTPTQGGTP